MERSLYDMPKDMLVKMICVIKAETDKKYEAILRNCHRSKVYKCSFKGCEHFCILDSIEELIFQH